MLNSQPVMILLRLVHIVAGVLWVGGAMVLASFIIPAARGERGLAFLREIIWTRNLPRYLNVTLGLALLSGLVMYGNLLYVTRGAYARSHIGMALGTGGALAILAALIATFVAAPAVHRAIETESDAALDRYASAMKVVVACLIGTAALMGVGRYL